MEQIFPYLEFNLWQSILTVVISFVIGTGLAVWEDAKKIKPSPWFMIIMTLPIFLPGIIVATGFIAVWGNNGYINNFLEIFNLPAIQWLYSPWAIIASHVYYNFPLFYLAAQNRLQSKDNNIAEIAKVMGANEWQIFKTITWPRIKSTVIGAGLLVFLYSFLSFSMPLILGGIKYQTLEVYIYNLATQQLDFSTALTLSLLQFIFLVILILCFLKYFKTIEEKKINFILQQTQRQPAVIMTAKLLLSLYIIAPLIAIIIKSWPLANYSKLLNNTSFINSLIRSLLFSVIVIIICLILNLFLLFWCKNKTGKFLIIFLAISPVAMGILLRLWFGQSVMLLILAYVFMLLPINYYLFASWWQAKPKNFLETLQTLGANKIQIIKESLCYLSPALKKIMALNIVFILGDLALASLLLPYGKNTAMSLSYNLLGSYRFTLASAGLSLTLLTILLLIAIIYFYDIKDRKFKRGN